MAKYKAVNIEFIPEIGKKRPANAGSAVHYALQYFIQYCVIDRTHEWTLELLLDLADAGYVKHFETADRDSPWYADVVAMCTKWFERTEPYLASVEVISVEQKRRIPVPSRRYDKSLPADQQPEAAVVPMSYIMDRIERYIDPITGEKVLRCVDYKTVRMPPRNLWKRIQARIYGLCLMILFKDDPPDRIEVVFDLIRFDEPFVTARYTVPELLDIWRDLRDELQRILDESGSPRTLSYTLGAGCRYCPIATKCPEKRKHLGGNLLSLTDEQQLVLRSQLQAQQDANKTLIEQIDMMVMESAIELDAVEFEIGGYAVEVPDSMKRKLDVDRARTALGNERFGELAPITMAKYDKWLKDGDVLTENETELLALCITKVRSETIKLKISPLEESEPR